MPDHYRITEMPEYKVNAYEWTPDIDKILAGLYTWKQQYTGDVVDGMYFVF